MERRPFSEEDGMKRKGKGGEEEKGKGKGKEETELLDTSVLIPPTESNSSKTMDSRQPSEDPFSRIASSAASLTSGFISNHAHGQQISSILSSNKAGSSITTKHPSTAAQETAHVTHTSSSSAQLPLGSTFRSGTEMNIKSSEESFAAFREVGRQESGSTSESNVNHKLADAAIAAMRDGSEVVYLLDTPLAVEDDDITPNMTDRERSALRRALFEERPSTGAGWGDVLDFVPEFISDRGSDEQLIQHLGVSNTDEARDIWFSQWGAVLSSYTDEVWGDLSPLVLEARQELQSASTSPEAVATSGLTAVRRLHQILAHVRGSST
ncbi:hypothetical protein F5B22DRAFT_268784 [Xylaria bambusicola]|uniref:uncharacterized protein n=1 Tax=Xylaria bambusicola TaxID=326684 RepID=UPI0020081782|nr:uncharacterized protein F5B22DRAFT_268784 [Xylaria bambusicola]KAI0526104.1 hypothetical protein F5B22DRAFT_268784 [Xylaria bambusicola]